MADRRWLITGVSSGLGKALMEAVVAHGHKVVGTVRRIPDPLPAFAGAANARLVTLDVTDSASVARGVAEAAEWLGGIDVVVNNAGVGMFGVVEACSIDDFRLAMEVNYFGTVAMCQAALPHLRATRGTLINVASMAGMAAYGGTAGYAASKHAVVGLTEALHAELAPLGVRVMMTLPGGYRTDFWSARSNTIRDGLGDVYGAYPCGQVTQRSAEHVGNELGDPAKLARLMIGLVEGETLPLYLVGGADGMAVVEAHNAEIAADMERNRAVGVGTAY
ncbi:SDR family NAD(P)-dependent oxidoreductase [Novosphingobium lentum]|uniref:SDR family NAD(P)-dependent oxidoreductase n=1 Tax=Novosphingobium lentum TaxID=145287 RepID=UPI000832D1D1|nr:SDR family NAD(P)-dependent oxidoreductase [Novosphingobium lentum]